MQRSGVLTFGTAWPAPVLSQIEGDGRAAWLITPDSGRIVAASPDGARLLGLKGDGAAPALDAAMPALVSLRAFVRCASEGRRGRAAPSTLSLLFWTGAGARTLSCSVRVVSGTPLVVAVIAEARALPADRRSDASPAPRTDAAHPRIVARRIRDGQTSPGARHAAGTETVALSGLSAPQPLAPSGVLQEPSLKARLAHELRTPVSAIAAAAEIMKEERFGPLGSQRYSGYASDIHASAQHALAVIERMLDEARVSGAEPDSSTLSFTELDAAALIQSSLSQLAPLAEGRGLTLAADLDPRLPHVIADATSLRQIVLNLLTNALKFTERGGRVVVRARSTPDGPLTIEVRNSGSGKPDTNSQPAPRPAEEGLGLGLPLARALAAANGARLVIESDPDHGTTAAIVFARDRVVPI